ncbi:hypothetical protein BJX99DRAFT_262969 [Aspergillus californicus]
MRFLDHLILMSAIAGQAAVATIALGALEITQGSPILNVAWIEGRNPCVTADVFTPISASGQNPCGIDFTLTNGYTYYEGNCGSGAIEIYNQDGSFNSQCKTKSWSCVSGSYTIRQTWTCS